jgi:hypothetical protein
MLVPLLIAPDNTEAFIKRLIPLLATLQVHEFLTSDSFVINLNDMPSRKKDYREKCP